MTDFAHNDLVRLASDDGPVRDEHGRNLEGMTGRLESLSPLFAHVALTCWPGVTVCVSRQHIVLVHPRPVVVAPEPEPVIQAPVARVTPVRKPRRKAARIAIAPSETIYPEPVAAAPRQPSRLREKLAEALR